MTAWRLGRWLGVGAATAAGSVAAGAAGVPAPSLVAGLLVGLAYALAAGVRLAPARPVVVVAQALVGVALGSYLDVESLAALGERWVPVVLVVAATLLASLAAGLVVAEVTGLDRPTAVLGLVAGGASGIVTMSDELGADGRLVAFMQYLRVFVVVLTGPLLVAFLVTGDGATYAFAEEASPGADLAFTLASVGAGLTLARLVPLPAATLLAPMLVAGALVGSGLAGGARLPGAVQEVAFAVIGLQVGLRFTPAAVAHARRLLPWTLAAVAALVVACAGLAGLLATVAGVPFVDAYLATTPGGIYAVLATAVGSGADTTFVLAVQALRMLVMVGLAPPLVRLVARPVRRPG